MYYLRLFIPGLLLMTHSLNAAELEVKLELTSTGYQRFVDRYAKQGYSLSDVSVSPGKRSEQFQAIFLKQKKQIPWKTHHGLDARQLETKLTEYDKEGFQPVEISGYEHKGSPRFAVIWNKGEQTKYLVRHSLSTAGLQNALLELKQDGYIPLKLDGYSVKGQPEHVGIWLKQNTTTWEATCHIPLDQFQKTFDDVTSKGFRLTNLCGYVVDRQPFYHALWAKDSVIEWMTKYHLTQEEFQSANKKLESENYQLVNLDSYRLNHRTHFSAIWDKVQTDFALPVWNVEDEIPVTGLRQKELEPLDHAIKTFLQEHHPPGAAVAVSYHGRLVYARGFGYADVEQKQPMQPESQFRIASISKPLTAVAIMKLIEENRLKLDSKVFDILTEYQAELSEEGVDPRLREVTIQQLLNHTGGWDRNASFDPMFRSVAFAKKQGKTPPAEAEDVIRAMVHQPLDFNPGERYAYSNFGYCLLGRTIEAVTGKPYHEYVLKAICMPLKMNQTQLGKTLLKDRQQNEVKYYSPTKGRSVFTKTTVDQVPQPYGAWYLEAMDSHGGWIASAPDLVRFATSFNTPEQCPILKAPTIAQMFARPAGLAGYEKSGNPKSIYYGCGWSVRPFKSALNANHWHNGALPGTSTILVRRRDGINWAILFNTRYGKEKKNLSSLIDGQMHEWVNQIRLWPEKDQLQQD